jgi:alkylation response protein AidB-like acyl-CoA dehydrogenase
MMTTTTSAANADDVRREVAAWLRGTWDPDRPLLEWRELLADSGWGAPAWPVELFGHGLPRELAAVVDEELDRAGAVGAAGGSGMSLAAPTILEHGTYDQQRRLLRGILTGAERWCQLFSEPGSGSDLAGLTTHAVAEGDGDGDELVVNGQKVWTTGARHAHYGMLLARTDWDAPKHRGLTWFAFPMRQPGVEVRPLKQMNGYASFNEVFITDARVPADNAIGGMGGGWAAARTTLANERGLGALRLARLPRRIEGRTASEAAAEAEEHARTYVWYPQRAGRADLVVPQAVARGRNRDPVVRQRAAALEAVVRTSRWNVQRARAQARPGPEGSIAKLCASDIARRAAALHATIHGAHAMLTGPSSPADGIVAEVIVSVPGASIAGGTDEIQHDIVGERVLGLPKEASVDAGVPFREVRTNQRP